jgi:hypothetical protein
MRGRALPRIWTLREDLSYDAWLESTPSTGVAR